MAASCTESGYSLHEELELLEAIYIHELTVEGPRERPDALSVLLHPSTGDEEQKQYVCLTLVIVPTDQYPESCPSLSIKAPRGLSDAHVSSILSNLRELADSRLGGPMLYELIEYAKESLTDNNVPSCACAICLCHFQDSDSFTRTECYHYFHCSCLLRYIDNSLQAEDTDHSEQVECPVCRLPVTYDLNVLRESGSAAALEPEVDRYHADEAMKKLQKKMALLYARQLKKGGIIDVEQERNKFLIGISSPKSNSKPDPSADRIHRECDKPTETFEEPTEPVRQDRRDQQDYGKKGGRSNKHKRGDKKPARSKESGVRTDSKLATSKESGVRTDGKLATSKESGVRTDGKLATSKESGVRTDGKLATSKESGVRTDGKLATSKESGVRTDGKLATSKESGVRTDGKLATSKESGVRTEKTEKTRQDEDKQREKAKKTRDGGEMSGRKDNGTAQNCRDSCTDGSRGTTQDEKQTQDLKENQKLQGRKNKPKSVNKKWRPQADEQNSSADVKIGGKREHESSKPTNRGERPCSPGTENEGSLKTPANQVRLPIANLNSNTNKKGRRPPPGFGELPGGSRSVHKAVKPPPGFELATNGAGGHSSGPKKAARPVLKDEDFNYSKIPVSEKNTDT